MTTRQTRITMAALLIFIGAAAGVGADRYAKRFEATAHGVILDTAGQPTRFAWATIPDAADLDDEFGGCLLIIQHLDTQQFALTQIRTRACFPDPSDLRSTPMRER